MSADTWIVVFGVTTVVISIGGSALMWHLTRRLEKGSRETLGLMEAHAQDMVEFLGHVRRTMEDLASRDPQIADTVELGLVDLVQQEKAFKALAAGDYRRLRKMTKEADRRS